MEINKVFGANLKRLRKKAGLSQLQFSLKADVGLQTIFRAEKKGILPRGYNIGIQFYESTGFLSTISLQMKIGF